MRNAIDYPLRGWFAWRRPGLKLLRKPLNGLYDHLEAEPRARAETQTAQLIADYHLQSFAADSSPNNFRETLYYLQLLADALERSRVSMPCDITAADVGASHWFYVQGLAALLRYWHAPQGRSFHLWGYEADPYRLYADWHSRYDHALAHLRDLPQATYLPQAFYQQDDRFDLITMLFPFVFEQDHLAWGLPDPLFSPTALLRAAWRSLSPRGVLIIVNQGEKEHAAQAQMMKDQGMQPCAAYRHESVLYSYALERYVLVARREH